MEISISCGDGKKARRGAKPVGTVPQNKQREEWYQLDISIFF